MPYAKRSDSKKKKRAVMKERMHAFKEGKMHAGSKTGPLVTDLKQAIAIGLFQSGQFKKKKESAKHESKGYEIQEKFEKARKDAEKREKKHKKK